MSNQEAMAFGSVGRTSHPKTAFAILAAVQSILIFTIALIMIPLPTIAEEFALSPAEVLLLQVAYGLPFSGLLLFGGRLADRNGARPMFVAGLAIFGVASIVAALTTSYGILITMRFLQGMGGAIIAPAALGLVRALFPDMAAFSRAMAVWGGVSVLGAVLGFISSGIIASFVSWRWMFVVPIAVAALGLLASAVLLPAGRPCETARPRLDPLGALLATGGIVLVSVGLIASHERNWASTVVLAPLAAGIVLLVGFMLVERRVRDPLLPPSFLLDPIRIVGLAGMLLAASASLLIEFVLLTYLQQVRDWTPFETAISFLPFAVALIGTNLLAPAVVGRLGALSTTVAGFVMAGVSLAWFTVLHQETAYLSVLLPAQALLAIGIALVFSGAAVLATVNVPAEQMGLAGGVMNTAMELGPTVGFAFLMAVAATHADMVEGYARAFGTAAFFYTLAALVTLLVALRRRGAGAR
ncbi:MFS transporter (plasmid) [Phyllobacteriaceae bacterium JZ32]